MRLEYALATKDWQTAAKSLDDPQTSTLMTIVSRVASAEDVSENLLTKTIAQLEARRVKHGFTYAQISLLKWKLGDKKGAENAAGSALATIKKTGFAPEPYEQFAAALKAGKPMSLAALSRAMQAAAKARQKK